MKYIGTLAVLFILLLAACSPLADLTPTPASSLPDLAISSAYVSIVDSSGRCLPDFALNVIVVNKGNAPASDVVLYESSTGQQGIVGTLDAGQSLTVPLVAKSSSGAYTVIVDPQNVIAESDENNNSSTFYGATATPPAQCTTAQTGGLLPTPTPLPPPSQVPQTLEGLIYADLGAGQIFRVFPGGLAQAVLQGTYARFSPDGSLALFESSGDIFLAEPMDNPGVDLTRTAGRLEIAPQFFGQDLMKVVFNSMGVNEAREKGWNKDILGYLSMVNRDGTGYTVLADVPSYTMPALAADGRTIAFDEMGMPMLVETGQGVHAFDPALYGYHPAAGALFFSPSFSPYGRWLTWWVAEAGSPSGRQFSLVLFDLQGRSSAILHAYSPLSTTLGWLPAPVWNGSEGWIAYQTRDEFTPSDLWIVSLDGSDAHRMGLATNPLWGPDQTHLAFVQSPPRSDMNGSAFLFTAEVSSWVVQSSNLPSGIIPLAWSSPASGITTYFPLFTPPADWLTYTNPYPPYRIQYPPDAGFEADPGTLTISLLASSSPLIERSITVETRPDTLDNCYAASPWDGKTLLNGLDLKYHGGQDWEAQPGGVRSLVGNYVVYHGGFCYLIWMKMTVAEAASPDRLDMDPEVLLDIISTLKIP